MIDAASFARNKPSSDFAFGTVSIQDQVRIFREFADMVESGRVLVMSVSSSSTLPTSDFLRHTLAVEYALREE